jgi:hypothetical protein
MHDGLLDPWHAVGADPLFTQQFPNSRSVERAEEPAARIGPLVASALAT